MTLGDGGVGGAPPTDGLGSWTGVRPTLWVRVGCGVAAVSYLGHLIACLVAWPLPIGDPIGEAVTFVTCSVAFLLAGRRPALAAAMAMISVAAEVYVAIVVVPTEWVASPPVLPVVVLAAGLFFGARPALYAAAGGVAAYPIVLLVGGRIGPAVGGIPPHELSRMVVTEFAVAASGILSWLALRTLARVHAEAEERRKLEARLQNGQRLQIIGELAGAAAHDFRNILGVFQNASTLLAASPDPEARQLGLDLLQSARSGQAITNRLLSLARKSDVRREAIDVARAVEEIRPLLTQLVGPRCTLAMAAVGPANAVADPSEVEQVVLNLAANARDAMSEGGTVSVRVLGVARSEAERLGSTLEASRQVVVEIADGGTGIAPEDQARIFEPFVTTKPRGEGTGLGLAMVRSIAVASGGAVAVESALGVGSRFRVFLPEVLGPCRSDATPLGPRH